MGMIRRFFDRLGDIIGCNLFDFFIPEKPTATDWLVVAMEFGFSVLIIMIIVWHVANLTAIAGFLLFMAGKLVLSLLPGLSLLLIAPQRIVSPWLLAVDWSSVALFFAASVVPALALIYFGKLMNKLLGISAALDRVEESSKRTGMK